MVLLRGLKCNISVHCLHGKHTGLDFPPWKTVTGEPILAVPVQRLERKAC